MADVLCVGAHPDDIEIGMGGTAAKAAASGRSVEFLSLTEAECSSNGNPSIRRQEAAEAASCIGAGHTIWTFPDRGLHLHSEDIRAELIQLIRSLRPGLVFAPAAPDRHPDHETCGSLVRTACFDAGVKKIGTGPPYRPEKLYYYQINGLGRPDTAVDISSTASLKREALQCYASQFEGGSGQTATPLTKGYLDDTAARDRLYGREAGTEAAEGFQVEGLPILPLFEEFSS
ncbi:bacillithiol biosynthesis deacetylase BshB1 [Alkalicoccus chagannorensis]|uniref:bacillithiol biosynthesis deacetylase BshB1 n=1 Tax=Alkalicoccus chagannorensis TaxID=427072 RepID=UPI0003F549C0|nr:bacillithiol biosynthesis deacetylase BshB1 [Alkalicoccus chagannorensis]